MAEENGMMGGYGMWAIMLFFLLAWGNNGFGGFGGNGGAAQTVANYATQADINNGFNFNALSNGIQNVERGVCSLGYDNLAQINNATATLNGAINGVGTAVMQASFAGQQGDCAINRNIDSVKYENAQNTCAITTNATGNTQRILDKLCQMEANAKDETINRLRAELQSSQFALAQGEQTRYILGQLGKYAPYSACGCV